MSTTVGDHLLERLSTWGVKRVYGYPGDGINGLLGAFGRSSNGSDPEGRPQFIQVRHEEMAAFMACAHAKFTGELGVCMATSGPGAIHLLNGLYDAKLDHQPVVAIVGQQARAGLGGNYQQEVDLTTLFKDVAHEYVEMAMVPAQIRHLVDRACRIALSERTVTAIIVPNDLQEADAVQEPPRAHGTVHSGPGYTRPRVVPSDAELDRAAEVLNAGERVAMLVGQGALGAGSEVAAAAEVLGAGVAKALLGKAVLPDDLPYVTGSIGLLGTKPSWTLMQDCDTLLMVGSSFPYSEFLPDEGAARGVQIDIDGKMIGIRYPMEVNLIGDSAETLNALLPRLERKQDRSWRQKIESEIAEWWRLMDERAQLSADPINPQLVFHELSKRLPDRAILSSDSGSSANWFARDVKLRAGMKASLSGTLATMGPGVPYAIAAKFAYPDRPVFALVGDGAMQMNGINELITIAKYRNHWSDQRLIILVLNNRDLNQVTWEQRAMEGNPKFEGSQDLPDFPYAGYAELIGLRGIRVDSPEQVGPAWDEALAADRPVVYEAVTDPEVPPLPPHITIEQAKALSSALFSGDPNSGRIIRESFKQKVQEFLPGPMTAAARERQQQVAVQELEVGAFTVPTDAPESDGTLAWDSTTIVVVHAYAGGACGVGYTYADLATATLVNSKLAGVVSGMDALAPQAAWAAMVRAIRNLGRPGISSMAIAAVDCALWDLKARLLELPLCTLLGAARDCVPVYGSGGFTSYSPARLAEQLSGWVRDGIPRVKMKVGTSPELDPARVLGAREAIGPNVELFVDANGAYDRKHALALAERFRFDAGVGWFEEPVSSDDLEGLRLLRHRGPAGMEIAAGEYGYDLPYFRRMVDCVDVLQADVTRCSGITELLRVDGLCRAHGIGLSLHCGPSIHLHPALALDRLVHLEYFHDHSRIEGMLFDGVVAPVDGALHPSLDRPGNGLELRRADAEPYAA